jgi:hypothetical protein
MKQSILAIVFINLIQITNSFTLVSFSKISIKSNKRINSIDNDIEVDIGYMDHGEVEWENFSEEKCNMNYNFQCCRNDVTTINNKSRQPKITEKIYDKNGINYDNVEKNFDENAKNKYINTLIFKLYILINKQFLNLDTFISEFVQMLQDEIVNGKINSIHIYTVFIIVFNYKKNILDIIDNNNEIKKNLDYKKMREIKRNISSILLIFTLILFKNVDFVE